MFEKNMWNRIIFVSLVFLPFQFATNLFLGNDMAVFRLLIPGIFLMWFFDALWKKRGIIPSCGFLVWMCAALFVGVCGVFVAPHADWAVRKAFFLGEFLMWLFVVSSLVSSGEVSKKTIVSGLVWSGNLLSFTGIVQWSAQFFWGLEPMLAVWSKTVAPFFLGTVFSETVSQYSSWLVNVGGVTLFRAIGVLPDPHIYAFFLEMCFPWTIFLFLKTKKWRYLFFSGVMMLGMMLSFSRGAYVGLLASGMLFIFFAPKWGGFSQKKALVLGTIFLCLFSILLGTNNFVRDRLGDTFFQMDSSGEERIVLWKEAFSVISENPIFGVGFAGFPEKVQPSAQYRDPIYAHNMYLDVATETGLLGLVVFLFGFVWSAQRFLTLGKTNIMYYGGFFALVCVGVHGMFDMPLYSVHGMGVLCAMLSLTVSKEKNEV